MRFSSQPSSLTTLHILLLVFQERSSRHVHLCNALQVGDLALQGLDVSECLSLVLLLGRQREGAAARVHHVEPSQLILQQSFSLIAALQKGLDICRTQQLVSLLVLQLLDPIPPEGKNRITSFTLCDEGRRCSSTVSYLLDTFLCLAWISLCLLCRLFTSSSAILIMSSNWPRPLINSVRKF